MAARGRPRKAENERRKKLIAFRVTDDLRKQLEHAREDRTLSAEIEMRLRRSFEIDPALSKQFGAARVAQVHAILEDLQVVEDFAGARWFESRFAWDEAKAYLEVFFGHLRMPEGERALPDALVQLYAKFPPGFLGHGLALQRLAKLSATKPGADKALGKARAFRVDADALRIAFAGKLNPPKPPKKRRTK